MRSGWNFFYSRRKRARRRPGWGSSWTPRSPVILGSPCCGRRRRSGRRRRNRRGKSSNVNGRSREEQQKRAALEKELESKRLQEEAAKLEAEKVKKEREADKKILKKERKTLRDSMKVLVVTKWYLHTEHLLVTYCAWKYSSYLTFYIINYLFIIFFWIWIVLNF